MINERNGLVGGERCKRLPVRRAQTGNIPGRRRDDGYGWRIFSLFNTDNSTSDIPANVASSASEMSFAINGQHSPSSFGVLIHRNAAL
jgi:hypothetical protein